MTAAPERTIVNPAREILKSGGPLFGFNVFESLRPSIIKIAAAAGYNMMLVENDHVVHNEEPLPNVLVLARDHALAPAVPALLRRRVAGGERRSASSPRCSAAPDPPRRSRQ